MIVTAVAARKGTARHDRDGCGGAQGNPLGLLFTAPLLTFSAVMGVAILGMFYSEHARGGVVPAAPVAVIGAVVALSICGAYAFLRQIKTPQ